NGGLEMLFLLSARAPAHGSHSAWADALRIPRTDPQHSHSRKYRRYRLQSDAACPRNPKAALHNVPEARSPKSSPGQAGIPIQGPYHRIRFGYTSPYRPSLFPEGALELIVRA